MLTRLNGTHFYVNAEMIKTVEETPNTVLTLTDQTKLVVVEPAALVVEKFIHYQQQINQPLHQDELPQS